jgi:hypothetical protein
MIAVMAKVQAEGAERGWLKTYLKEGANHQKVSLRRRMSNIFDDSDELLELGSDGHEERCHKCRRFGDLLCCDGCPISMHSSCLQLLSLQIPQPDEEWYCPICCEKKATDLANHAEKVTCCKPKYSLSDFSNTFNVKWLFLHLSFRLEVDLSWRLEQTSNICLHQGKSHYSTVPSTRW